MYAAEFRMPAEDVLDELRGTQVLGMEYGFSDEASSYESLRSHKVTENQRHILIEGAIKLGQTTLYCR